jgi:hypothetical protein
VNRRHFVGQVVLGSAVASFARPRLDAQTTGGLRIKFVGMMGYITRSDQSLLIALPGEHKMGHFSHVPFLMARTGSRIAKALGLTPMPGVVAGAFDIELADTQADAFVFRCLDGCDLEVRAQSGETGVQNRATYIAQMQAIRPGKRLRHNLRRWAQSTITVQGGTLVNSAAHPDAGKVWSFGNYQQRLTDATLYGCSAGTVRLDSGARVSSFTSVGSAADELWVVSAAAPRTDAPNPKRLEHGQLLFEYFADAESITPTCDEAQGRITLATDMPCALGSASMGHAAATAAPPFSDLCPGGSWSGE